MIIKLVIKTLIQDKLRFALAVFGVAASVGLIIWALGLRSTTAHQSREKVRRMTAPFNTWVATTPIGKKMDRRARGASMKPTDLQLKSTLPEEVVKTVKESKLVESVVPYKVVYATIDYRPGERVMQGPPLIAGIVQAKNTGCPYTEANINGRWPDPESAKFEAAVCSAVFTPRKLTPPVVGSDLVLVTSTGALTVKITAIVDYPECVQGFPTIFTTKTAMRQLYNGGKIVTAPDLLLCTLKAGNEVEFNKKISEDIPSEFATSYNIAERSDVEDQHISDKQRNFKRQAPLLLTLSLLTALCMMMNSLTIGVRQRLRSLALLRSAGMTRAQATAVIVAEGVLVALFGWILGSLGGWAMLMLFVSRSSETFPAGAFLGWTPPITVGIGVAFTMLLSLFWPCRRVMLIRPLDALEEHCHEPYNIKPFKTILGILMMFPMLVLAFPMAITPMARSLVMLLGGIPLHIGGMFLALPAFIRLAEKVFVPPIAKLLHIDSCLIKRRISGNITQTTGMVLTLAVGLGTFTAIHIWGSSLTKPFLPSQEFPDVIVSFLPSGVERGAAAKVAPLKGVADNICLPIEVCQLPIVDKESIKSTPQGKRSRSKNVLLFGTNPVEAFGGENPLAPFKFVEGERKSTAEKLTDGRHCIITSMFARDSGLKTGDTLTINRGSPRSKEKKREERETSPGNKEIRNLANDGGMGGPPRGMKRPEIQKLAFKIAGVVDLNWHLVTSRANLRGRNNMPGFTTGPVFVEESVVRRLNNNRDKTYFLWTNLSKSHRKLGPLEGGIKLESEIRKTLKIDERNTVRVHHRDEIEDGTVSHSTDLLGDMARAPFWSLIVLATGIITLLIASYHSTARETAIMRAIGLTRGQLGRILFCEAALVALCGIFLSLVSGFCIGWSFTGWTRAWMPFEGLPVSLSIPWLNILKGTGFAFALCATMAVPPIFYLVRKNTIFEES